jgi:hypothetical protein
MSKTKAAALATYIRQLPSFTVRKDLDYGDYDHIGATLIAIILQAGLTWKTTVKPRVEMFKQKFPGANTVSGFLDFLQQNSLAAALSGVTQLSPTALFGWRIS